MEEGASATAPVTRTIRFDLRCWAWSVVGTGSRVVVAYLSHNFGQLSIFMCAPVSQAASTHREHARALED